MLLAVAQLIAGLFLLWLGGEYLVRGATRVALLARISTAVVALTVVAMGTSLPELAVSLGAAARGVTDLAYGNIVGSTIFNIGVILGVSAALLPISVKRQTIWIEYPFMVFMAILVLVLCGGDRLIDRWEGALLFAALVLFTAYIVLLARRDVEEDEATALKREVQRAAHLEGSSVGAAWGKNLLLIGAGIVVLVIGSDQAVRGAVKAATLWGVDARVVGLTVVAMGTSLPELATSVVAARRGEQEIALGNVIGSNIFNLAGVLGPTAVVFPVPINPAAAEVDNWVMLGFCAVMFPLMIFDRRLGRVDGSILLIGFAVYIGYVLLVR